MPSMTSSKTSDNLPAGTLTVTGLHPSGAGLSTFEGLTVLVPGAIPGDVVDARWTPPKPGGRFGLAQSFTVVSASPDADPTRCPLADACGGCPAGRLRYEAELAVKTRLLLEEPLRAAGFAVPVETPAGQPEGARTGFRNKAILRPVRIDGKLRFGMYRARSHEVVPAEDCPQTPAWMAEALRRTAEVLTEVPLYDEKTGEGILRAVLLRDGAVGGTTDEEPGKAARTRLLTPVLKSFEAVNLQGLDAMLRAALAGRDGREGKEDLRVTLIWRENAEPGNAVPGPGRSWSADAVDAIDARVMDDIFAVGPDTFLQVNAVQTPVLYRKAIDALELTGDEDLLDLYSGVGTITLALARRTKGRVLGIEVNPKSVENARRNALRAGLDNRTRFEAGLVEDLLSNLLAEEASAGFRPVKAVIDPAFKGIEASVAKALGDAGLTRLVYVSCNPQTFVRDAKRLEAAGLKLIRVEAVDMFPGALHLEAVGTFVRNG